MLEWLCTHIERRLFFSRNSSAKLKVNNTEKRKNNGVKASSTKYFRFVFCINMLVCIINVRENHGHAFHSKDFLKGVFGWCVCVVPDLLSVMNQEKKTTNRNDNLMLPEMRTHIYAMNKHSFFLKSCMFFDVSIYVRQNKRVYFVILGCVEFVIHTRSI